MDCATETMCGRTVGAGDAGRTCCSGRLSMTGPWLPIRVLTRPRSSNMPRHGRIPSMHIYLVGGAVRDKLQKRPVVDHDHVVVGAKPEELLALGYKPVGKDFPVFLHPRTGE